jgi:hypothetical protein
MDLYTLQITQDLPSAEDSVHYARPKIKKWIAAI